MAEHAENSIHKSSCNCLGPGSLYRIKGPETQNISDFVALSRFCFPVFLWPPRVAEEFGIDLAFHLRFLGKLKHEDHALAHVLWQGSLQHTGNSEHVCCPHCESKLTFAPYRCSWISEQRSAVRGRVDAQTLDSCTSCR